MRPTTLAILTASALVAPAVVFSADGGLVVSGSAGVGLRAVGDNASDPSKANEYRDLSPGVIGIFDVKGRGDEYYFNAFGENLGRDDQYFARWICLQEIERCRKRIKKAGASSEDVVRQQAI